MMRLRWASAIAALCVLASAAPASAECAGVLWSEFVDETRARNDEHETIRIWGVIVAVHPAVHALRALVGSERPAGEDHAPDNPTHDDAEAEA